MTNLATISKPSSMKASSEFMINSLSQISRALDALGEIADPIQRLEGAADMKSRAKFLLAASREVGLQKQVIQAAMALWCDCRRARGLALLDMEKARGASEKGWKETRLHRVTAFADIQITKRDAYQEQLVARLPEDKYLAFKAEKLDHLSWAAVFRYAQNVFGVPHVAKGTGENEWYTPPEFIRAARLTMGEIDLDPASTRAANMTVRATTYYTIEDDGLARQWRGRVWMNPPYSRPLINQFCAKLVEEIAAGRVTQACVLVNNATETEWFQGMLALSPALCLVKGRVKFLNQKGFPDGQPLQGQVVLYFGGRAPNFHSEFRALGVIADVR